MKLKFNIDKTDLIIIDTKQLNKIVDYFSVKTLGNDTLQSYTVWNLYVIFNSDFCFPQYIPKVRRSCFYDKRDFRLIRYHLSTAKTLSVALIDSRLDYCNSLLNNIAKNTYLCSNVDNTELFSTRGI